MDKLRELTPLQITFFSGERPTDEKLEGMMRQVEKGFDFVESSFGDLFGDSDSPALWTTNVGRDLGDRASLNPIIQPDKFIANYVQELDAGKTEHELDLIPVGQGMSILVSSTDSSVAVSQYKATEELILEPGDWTIRPGKFENGIQKNSRKLITHSPSIGGSIIFNSVTSGKGSTYHGSTHNLIPSIAQAKIGGPFVQVSLSNAQNNIYTITLPFHEKELDELNNNTNATISNISANSQLQNRYELPSYFFDPAGLDLLADNEFGNPKQIPLYSIQLWDWDAKKMVTGLERIVCSQNAGTRKFQFTMQFRPDIVLNTSAGRYVVTTSGTTVYEMLGALQKQLIFHNHDGDDQVRHISHKSLMGLRTSSNTPLDRSSYYGTSSIDNNDHSMYFHRDGYTPSDIGGGGNVIRGNTVIGSSVTGPAEEHENYNLLQDSNKLAFGKVLDGGEIFFDKIKQHNLPESRGNLPSFYSDTALLIRGSKSDLVPGLYTTLVEGNFRTDSNVVLGTTKDHDVFVTGDLYVFQSLLTTPKTLAEISEIAPETGKQVYSLEENAPVFWNGSAWVNAASSGYSTTIGDGVSTFGKYNGNNTATIQAAIDEVEAKGGGKILLQRGVYNFGNLTLQMKTGVQLVGEGSNTVINSNGTAIAIGNSVTDSAVKDLKINNAQIAVLVSGSRNTLDKIDALASTEGYSQTNGASDNFYGEILLNSYLVHSGELGPTFDTGNRQIVTTPAGYAGAVKAIDWSDKKSLLQKIKRSLGTGTVSYEDSTDCYLGRGRYAFTGMGTWIIESFIPVAEFLGVGGSVAHKASASGGNFVVGVMCYDSDFTNLGDNGGFLVNNLSNTTSWQFRYNYARLTGATAATLKPGTKFVKMFVRIATNPGTIYLDALDVTPMGYSAFALYF